MSKLNETPITAELSKRLKNVLEDISTNEELPLELLFERAKNIRLPEHKPAYPKSIKKEA